jgi:type VI secretion system protein ImpH
MAPADRIPAADLIACLLRQPQSADLFQAIGLLERSRPQASPLGHGSGRGEAVQLGATLTLAFAPGDVTAVRPVRSLLPAAPEAEAEAEANTQAETAPAWRLETPVLALAGATGPLPLPFVELLQQQVRLTRDRAPLDFLDLFHHRWLSFFYRGRKRHRLSLQWESAAQRPLARALDALAHLGLGSQGRRALHGPGGEQHWLCHAGLLGAAPRSMAQLEVLLSERLGLPVRGQSFVGGWLALDARDTPALGRGLRLGERATLGRRAWDPAAGLRLQLGPVPAERWADCLPGGALLARAQWLCASHAAQPLATQIELIPAVSAGPGAAGLADLVGLAGATVLGRSAQPARLGWTTWLARGRQPRALAPVRLGAARLSAPPPAPPLNPPLTPRSPAA